MIVLSFETNIMSLVVILSNVQPVKDRHLVVAVSIVMIKSPITNKDRLRER